MPPCGNSGNPLKAVHNRANVYSRKPQPRSVTVVRRSGRARKEEEIKRKVWVKFECLLGIERVDQCVARWINKINARAILIGDLDYIDGRRLLGL